MKNRLWRIVDANVNRSREGLRVCEDILRFVCDDRALAQALKKCRHQLTQTILALPIPAGRLLKFRESAHDVGRKSVIRDQKKTNLASIFSANFKRTQESLRVLGECSKIEFTPLTKKFQKLRFEIYELEKRAAQKF